jgi:hypothetical protein
MAKVINDPTEAGRLPATQTLGLVQAPAALTPQAETPPVAPQRVASTLSGQLQSERVVVAAPLSFAGSAARIWKLVRMTSQPAAQVVLAFVAVLLILAAWTFVLGWYMVWGLWLVPYRMIRRGQRKDKRQALQHREVIAAIKDRG